MEIFDICDESGKPTGETVERSKAHAEGICHRTAHTWVIREDGETTRVLLQKRSRNKDSFPGRLDTSSAGHIQAGDEPLVSAQRELAEELGIVAGEDQLIPIGVFRIQYEKEFYGKMFRDNEVSFVHLYREPVEIADLKLQEEEVESVEWHTLREVDEALKHHDLAYCVPSDGFAVLKRWLSEHGRNA